MYDYGSSGAYDAILGMMTGGMLLVNLVIGLFFVVAYWKLFTKAGEPGWASIIPIYNALVILKIAGKPWWWILLSLVSIIPFVGWIVALVLGIMIMHGISVNFGKDSGFTVGLVLLPWIFIPILAFGSAQYLANSKVEVVGSIEDLEDLDDVIDDLEG